MEEKQGLPILSFATEEAWEQWLEANHTKSKGIWMKIAKKGSADDSISRAAALDVALCYGWIDGQAGKYDEANWLQRFTPRRRGSNWSKINRDRVEELIAAGRMKPAGLRAIEEAKANRRWDAAYDGQRSMAVPDDLRQALEENEPARQFFDSLDSRNRYAILYRIHDAKKPETRARRIAKFVSMLSEQKKIYQ